jgi:hypothetical protein
MKPSIDEPRISDEGLVAVADRLFQELDDREAADELEERKQ